MEHELDYEAIEYVRNFIPYKAFFDDLLPQYDEDIEVMGLMLQKHVNYFAIVVDDGGQELLDFFDGNGFKYDSTYRGYEGQYIIVFPQYPPEPEPDTGKTIWFDGTVYTTTTTTLTFDYSTDEKIEETRQPTTNTYWFYEKSIKYIDPLIYTLTNKKGRSPPC